MMIYLQAFVIGGLFCLLTHLIFRISKRSVVFMLTFAFCVGILMSALGWMDIFTGFAQGGMFVLLYDAGEAAYLGMASLLAGDPVPIIRYVCLVLFCFIAGISCGVILHQRHQARERTQSTPPNECTVADTRP